VNHTIKLIGQEILAIGGVRLFIESLKRTSRLYGFSTLDNFRLNQIKSGRTGQTPVGTVGLVWSGFGLGQTKSG
jgi:hypothetical protein